MVTLNSSRCGARALPQSQDTNAAARYRSEYDAKTEQVLSRTPPPLAVRRFSASRIAASSMLRHGARYNTRPGAGARAEFPAPFVPPCADEHGDLSAAQGCEIVASARGRLIAAMGHAVRAFFVAASPVRVPVVVSINSRTSWHNLAEQVTGFCQPNMLRVGMPTACSDRSGFQRESRDKGSSG